MKVLRATHDNLEQLIPLFDSYRIFYKKSSNLIAGSQFLTERFKKEDSIIFIAISENNEAIGFTQLYPSFSSVSLQRTYILNDLFVAKHHRNIGVAESLMTRAKQFAIADGAKGITLETDFDNPAQQLYERLGWEKDTQVIHYTWKSQI